MLSSLIWNKDNLTSNFTAIFVTAAQNISSTAVAQSNVNVPLFPVKLEWTMFLKQPTIFMFCKLSPNVFRSSVLNWEAGKMNFHGEKKWHLFLFSVFFFHCTAQFNEKTLILMTNFQKHLNISLIEPKICFKEWSLSILVMHVIFLEVIILYFFLRISFILKCFGCHDLYLPFAIIWETSKDM